MTENKYLNEEKYQKAEKSITLAAILVLVVGLCIGGFLIYRGVAKPGNSKVESLKVQLETKKRELEDKGIRFNTFAKYSDGEAYDLKIITNALDPSFNHCAFDEYKNNSITKEYCSAKNSTGHFASTTSTMFGAFICIATCMISGYIFMIAKRRHILAYQVQQVMPVAQEGLEKVAPTIGKAGASIAEEMAPAIGKVGATIAKEMAPVYGEVAKEISKGIKEGLKDNQK